VGLVVPSSKAWDAYCLNPAQNLRLWVPAAARRRGGLSRTLWSLRIARVYEAMKYLLLPRARARVGTRGECGI